MDAANEGSPEPGGTSCEAQSLCAAFQSTAKACADRIALRLDDGTMALTWAQCAAEVERLAGGLAALGIQARDTVALMLRNRPQFNLLDAAAIHLGAVPWSIYVTSSAEQIRVLLSGSASRVVICERDFLPRLSGSLDGTAVDHVFVVDQLDTFPAAPAGWDFAACWRSVQADDPLTIIWTSGTTGIPKPVELTHRGMIATLNAMTALTQLKPGGRATSYLPSAHVGDRWSAHYWWMMQGLELTCVPDGRRIMAILPSVRPTLWGSVPRVWEKLRAALMAEGIREPRDLSPEAAATLRERIGLDQAQCLFVGAAPIPPETLHYFETLGLPICELYGMSETCGLLTVNPPNDRRIGTVGAALPGVELHIASDGEVLARGPQTMRGYRNRPDLTAETIVGGWLHTGDLGRLDSDGYLTITGRKKELIINAAGKNMSPSAIEAALVTAGPLIGQACVIGDRRAYNVALLVADPEAANAWAAANGRLGKPYAELVRDGTLLEAIQDEVARANERLSRVEQIRRWRLMDTDWLADSEELTPTMKLKRRQIAEKYARVIEALYAEFGASSGADPG
ncbi:MAG: AMP-dependent synthetase/ligase [Stellaceae bacterium]